MLTLSHHRLYHRFVVCDETALHTLNVGEWASHPFPYVHPATATTEESQGIEGNRLAAQRAPRGRSTMPHQLDQCTCRLAAPAAATAGNFPRCRSRNPGVARKFRHFGHFLRRRSRTSAGADRAAETPRRVVVASESIGSDYRGEGYAVDHDEWEDEAVNQCARNYCYDSDYVGLNDVEIELVQDVIEIQAQAIEEELDRLQEERDYYNENPELDAPEGLFLSAAQIERELQLAFPPAPIESKFGRIICPSVIKVEPKMSQMAIAMAANNPPAPDQKPLTNADAWNNAEFGEVLHAAEPTGQRNLLEWENTGEPPGPDDYPLMTDFHAAYDRWLISSELQEIIHTKNDDSPAIAGTDTEREGAREISVIAPTSSRCDVCSEHDGASIHSHDERLGSQKGDRILGKSGADSGDSGGIFPHQSTELDPIITPQAPIITPQALEEQRPPGRGDGRGSYVELAIGMLVGRRRDRQHIGKILNIYQSRRGIWRAKVQPLNKSNFVYFDCAALVEQKLLYDYEMKPGGFIPSGEVFNKARCEIFEVFSCKVRPKPTNWTPGQLSELSAFKLKQIARDMEILAIPGTAGKRSLIRAILAEQTILQEKLSAQRERETSSAIAQKQKSAPATNKQKRTAAFPLGIQLSLFDVAV